MLGSISARFLWVIMVAMVLSFYPALKSYAAPEPAATVQAEPSSKAEEILKQINSLVLEFYPKAKVVREPKSIHFEEKIKEEISQYSGKKEMAPKSGGILGDVSVQDGEYIGPDKISLDTEVQDGFHSVLVMAPYSLKHNQHILGRILLPPDAEENFKKRLRTIVASFKDGATVRK